MAPSARARSLARKPSRQFNSVSVINDGIKHYATIPDVFQILFDDYVNELIKLASPTSTVALRKILQKR